MNSKLKESKFREIVDSCFKKLKQEFYTNHKFDKFEEDNTPFLLTMRDVIEALPPRIKAIEVKRKQSNTIEIGFLIEYDYSELQSTMIEYCGIVECNGEKLIKFASNKFGLKENQLRMCTDDICSNFSPMMTWEPSDNWHLHFIPSNILENTEIFYNQWKRMLFQLREVPILSEKFQRGRFQNFNEIYGLESDPILPLEELTKSELPKYFLGLNISTVQKNVADIQLIPKVPKEIQTIIKRAKELYIFGYFRYDFFTISQHYAFLALDVAVKTRYVISLKKPVILTNSKRDLKHEMKNPTYYDIETFGWKTKGWDIRSMLANGKPFPYNGKKLLDWLEKNHLIRKWEKGIYDAGLSLRHDFSHPEKPSTLLPGAKILQTVVNEINYMFHKQEWN